MANRSESIKILLIAPGPKNAFVGAIPHLPLALLSLAAYVREYLGSAVTFEILDMHISNLSSADFKSADIVGITAMTGSQIKYGLHAAELVRSYNGDALIVWGGIHASLLPEQTVKSGLVDVVVIGEGEKTFLDIVQAAIENRKIENIPGTCYLHENEVLYGEKRLYLELNNLPIFAYDLVDLSDYKGIEYQFDYQSSRGCPFRCGFCYNVAFCERRYRQKSAEKVVEELFSLSKKFNVKNFAFCDDEFFIARKRIEAIMEGIISRNGEFGLIASCRLDVVEKFSADLLEKMKKAGVSQIFFGAESGSPRTLELIKKDITVEQILAGAEKVARAGIRPVLSFMSGFPDEKKEDLEMTLDLIMKLWQTHPKITVNGIFPFNPYPGTELYNRSVELGFVPPKSLKDWAEWSFQYEPDNPWLDNETRKIMQISFYMVRFKYYLARFEDRHKNTLKSKVLNILFKPLLWSIDVRLKKKWFGFSLEWHLFAYLARKTFGYL